MRAVKMGVTLAVFLSVWGCATTSYWRHPTKSTEDFQRDDATCEVYSNTVALGQYPILPPTYTVMVNPNTGFGQITPNTAFNDLGRSLAHSSAWKACIQNYGWQEEQPTKQTKPLNAESNRTKKVRSDKYTLDRQISRNNPPDVRGTYKLSKTDCPGSFDRRVKVVQDKDQVNLLATTKGFIDATGAINNSGEFVMTIAATPQVSCSGKFVSGVVVASCRSNGRVCHLTYEQVRTR